MKKKELTTFRENYTEFSGACYSEGLALAVHFDEKDDIKQYGCKWDADKKQWWLPKHKVCATATDDLNSRKMIVGQYGTLDEDTVTELTEGIIPDAYSLQSMEGDRFQFEFFSELDLVRVKNVEKDSTTTQTTESARTLWDALTAGGYVRV